MGPLCEGLCLFLWWQHLCNDLHFTKFLTIHQENCNQIYMINGVLSMTGVRFIVKSIVAYLRLWSHTCM